MLFWWLLGSGFAGSFRVPGAGTEDVDFLAYFFPGTIVLLVLFAAIFSTISVIEERRTGFLQGIRVAPSGGRALIAGKVLGGASVAWLQGTVLLLLAPWAGLDVGVRELLAAAGILALLSVALTAVGLACAWRVDSTQGFHGVMNLLLVPAWMLSGAIFPLEGSAGWLQTVAWVDPLTYGVSALRWVLQPGIAGVAGPFDGLVVPLSVTAVLTLAAFGVAWLTVRGDRR